MLGFSRFYVGGCRSYQTYTNSSKGNVQLDGWVQQLLFDFKDIFELKIGTFQGIEAQLQLKAGEVPV